MGIERIPAVLQIRAQEDACGWLLDIGTIFLLAARGSIHSLPYNQYGRIRFSSRSGRQNSGTGSTDFFGEQRDYGKGDILLFRRRDGEALYDCGRFDNRMNMEPVAVYVHTPFCPSKCGYCDFNSYAMNGDIIGRTVNAIINEVRRSPHRGRPAKTIFFGGGTPTFLPIDGLMRILGEVVVCHPPVENCEITSEANPGTVDAAKFRKMRDAGFNRLSLGAQSFFESDLVRLGRVHTSGEIEKAVASAKDAGFENINLDLMFALHGQTLRGWRANLDRAIALNTEHLSLYCLTIEPNTPFYKQRLRGQLDLPGDEAQVRMYDEAVERAEAVGFAQYEISNFAKPGFECRHNLSYWKGEEYPAYGPGAVEQVGGVRWTHIKHPERYCDAVEKGFSLACSKEVLTTETRDIERIMLGLRLNEGISVDVTDMNPTGVDRAAKKGWIKTECNRVRLTPEGRHYCNEVIVELI